MEWQNESYYQYFYQENTAMTKVLTQIIDLTHIYYGPRWQQQCRKKN